MTEHANMNVEIAGIKCDADGCDFIDETVTQEELPNWVDKPCPNCGGNLLTQADWAVIQELMSLVELANSIDFGEEDTTRVTMPFSMDGSGNLTMGEPVEIED